MCLATCSSRIFSGNSAITQQAVLLYTYSNSWRFFCFFTDEKGSSPDINTSCLLRFGGLRTSCVCVCVCVYRPTQRTLLCTCGEIDAFLLFTSRALPFLILTFRILSVWQHLSVGYTCSLKRAMDTTTTVRSAVCSIYMIASSPNYVMSLTKEVFRITHHIELSRSPEWCRS